MPHIPRQLLSELKATLAVEDIEMDVQDALLFRQATFRDSSNNTLFFCKVEDMFDANGMRFEDDLP